MAIYMCYIPEEQNWNLMCSSETIFEFFTAVFCRRIVQVKQNNFMSLFFFLCVCVCVCVVVAEFFTTVFCRPIVQVKQNSFMSLFFFFFPFFNCLKPLFFDSTVSIYFDSQETSIIIAVITTDCGCHITILLPLADGVSSGAKVNMVLNVHRNRTAY